MTGRSIVSDFSMEVTCIRSEELGCETEPETNGEKTAVYGQNDVHDENDDGGKEFVPPAVGMEFESYDDGYNYYNCYAKEVGFSVRVKNSWFKRNNKEKYGAVLCCSSQGFKRVKGVNRLRKETRTGCLAMMRMRLVDSKRWQILEVTLDHNHMLGVKDNKSNKRKVPSNADSEVQPVKLYRALVIDGGGEGKSVTNHREVKTPFSSHDHLNLKKGDTQAVYNYFTRMQLTSPNFFYTMDLNEEGRLRNLFWADARSRAASGYFCDVIFFDNTFLSSKYETPLVSFVGLNHHGQFVLLGCGLLSSESMESYNWILKAWVTCTSVRAPQTIITERCKNLQGAVADVFPRSNLRFGLSHIMRRVPENLGGLRNYDAIRKSLVKVVYEAFKPHDFEAAWGFMIQQFGITDNEWLQLLYKDRVQWAPVYLKDTLFVGMATARPGETLNAFFDKYLHKQTPVKEFLDKYELALQKKHKEEAIEDMKSRISSQELKTRCSFELQLSKVYTRAIFKKFQLEVEEMYSCFSTTPIHVEASITIYLVKERALSEGNRREIRDYEVLFNQATNEVNCICGCFNFYGYLCRHALCVLDFNGVEQIPAKYILSRWKVDFKRLCGPGTGFGDVDASKRVQMFSQLYQSALQVVEEGVISIDHYNAALRALEESLDIVHSTEAKHV